MAALVRTTGHLYEGDRVAFFDGGQATGTARTGTVVTTLDRGYEVVIQGDDGQRYYVPRNDAALR